MDETLHTPVPPDEAGRAWAQRVLLPELMDDPTLDEAEHRRALAGLRRIHRCSGTVRSLMAVLERVVRNARGRRTVRVLDIACGGGDVAVALEARARRRGWRVQVDGCDRSERASAWATRTATQRGHTGRFFVADALEGPFPESGNGYDLSVSTLFLHHLTTEQARRALTRMAKAAAAGVVDDLARSRAAWWAAWAGTRVLSRSRVVHADGPQSVRAGWTRAELVALANDAELPDAVVHRRAPFHWFLQWGLPNEVAA